MFTKRAVKIDAQRNPYLDCECGNRVSLPQVKGLPIQGYLCLCGILYNAQGWILSRPTVAHGNA